MGNEIMTQNVQNYGNFNPSMYNMGMAMPMGMNTGLFGSMGQIGMNNYSNDIFGSNLMNQVYNQNSYPQAQNPQIQTPQNQSIFNNPQVQTPQIPAQTFTGNETSEPTQQTEEQPQKTHAGKKLGVIAGLGIPLITAATKIFKGAKFSDVFKFKELGVKGAAFALAGWCAGAILDGFVNSIKIPAAQN